MTNKIKKKQKLRNNEYYNAQSIFDDLYQKSTENYKFKNLIEIITDEHNIELAYRNIKKNTGSRTSGTNNRTIEDLKTENSSDLIQYARKRLSNYSPHKIRRVEIPKPNGKTRPLGIATIEDRLLQQCILQVLDPVCEAKFHKHSYGFRQNRSTHHALARCYHLIHFNKLYYAVDIDIKGFFDNVNHGKLLKQMWAMGIQDKQLLCIISKMLKAPINGIGIPSKGTPQGGILSPLLSNIVLNELDWWISNQWETFETKRKYAFDGGRISSLKNTQLKEFYIVRYADDFKIFCRNYSTAKKIFTATKMWLEERLHLEISDEKSKIVNLQKNYSEFLGFKIKVRDKGKKKVVKSHVSDKAKKKIVENLKQRLTKLQKDTTKNNVISYNSAVLGAHNYYRVATHVNADFSRMAYIVNKNIDNRTKKIRGKTGIKSKVYEKFYGNYNFKVTYIHEIALFPMGGIRTKPPMSFSQNVTDYTKEGRLKIHEKLKGINQTILKFLLKNPIPSESVEFNDNRISLFVGQGGKCAISGIYLKLGEMDAHHKVPKELGGTDEYSNLIFIKSDIHKIIHATDPSLLRKYLEPENLDKKAIKRINQLRILVGNFEI
jgi:group II intron reverse transcriptase/maturase